MSAQANPHGIPLPTGSIAELMPAGRWWDAVKVPATLGAQILARLEDLSGAVITDGRSYYWLIPPGSAATWAPMAGVQVLGTACYVAVPPITPLPQARVRWAADVSPEQRLTDARCLGDALMVATG